MTLASADDFEGGEAILTHRFMKEYPGGGTAWIGGEAGGYCSAITGLPGGVVVRDWKPCSGLFVGYCEFNGNLLKFPIIFNLITYLNLFWDKNSNCK